MDPVTDKNKVNQSSAKPNGEEKASTNKSKQQDKWKAEAITFASSAGLVLLNGALFALGGIAAHSLVSAVRSARQVTGGTGENVVSFKRQQVGNA